MTALQQRQGLHGQPMTGSEYEVTKDKPFIATGLGCSNLDVNVGESLDSLYPSQDVAVTFTRDVERQPGDRESWRWELSVAGDDIDKLVEVTLLPEGTDLASYLGE